MATSSFFDRDAAPPIGDETDGDRDEAAFADENREEQMTCLVHMPNLQKLMPILRDPSHQLTDEQLFQGFDELKAFWLDRLNTTDSAEQLAYDSLGLNTLEYMDQEELCEQYERNIAPAMALYYRMCEHNLVDPEMHDSQMSEAFTRILLSIKGVFEVVESVQRLRVATNIEYSIGTSCFPLDMMSMRPGGSEKSKKALMSLVSYMLRCAFQDGYRKFGDTLYREIVRENRFDPQGNPLDDDEQGQMVKTHAWEPIMTIQEYVYARVTKERDAHQWENLLSTGSMAKNVAEYLERGFDFELPRLKTDRRVFSFLNGIYNASNDTFWLYSSNIPSNVTACKFFELQFKTFRTLHDFGEGVDESLDIDDWYNIPTPNFQKILEYQQLPPEVIEWFYVFMGRLMYDVHTLDNWQVCPFVHGLAGTGKSTLATVILSMYPKENIGILSNNIEKTFGLSALADKFVFLCYELKRDFNLDQGEFQSMVTGEELTIAVKRQTARTVRWKSHGFLIGNEFPLTWTDNSGSISRRVPVMDFKVPVEAEEGDLDEKLKQEMAAILLKCNLAYLDRSTRYGKMGIWDVLPDYFKETKKSMRSETHRLYEFLHKQLGTYQLEITQSPDDYIELEDFKCDYYGWIGQRGRDKFNEDYYSVPFREFGLRTVKAAKRTFNGTMKTTTWLVGIRKNVEGQEDGF